MREDLFSEFEAVCGRYPSEVLFYEYRCDSLRKKTFREAFQEVQKLRNHLSKLHWDKGTRAALLSENCSEWLLCYLAAVSLGWIVVPLDPKLGIGEWTTHLRHAEAQIIFCSPDYHRAAQTLKDQVPSLSKILSWTEKPQGTEENYPTIQREDFWETPAFSPIEGDEVASLLYTSGTTGGAKGVLLTHRNFSLNSKRVIRSTDEPKKIRSLLLPLHHVYGFIVSIGTLFHGQSLILYPQFDLKAIAESFEKLSPHFVSSVPSLFTHLALQIRRGLSRGPAAWVFSTFRAVGRRLGGAKALRLRSAKKLLFKKAHRFFGGRIEYFNSGGAPLEPWVGELFHVLGFPILEGYGLTETSAIITAGDFHRYKIGSVGKRPSDLELRIDQPDGSGVGEIWVRGATLMKGYFKSPEATRRVIDEEGWFHTGDLGYLDSDQFLFITGRKKEVIVTAGGKKIFPEELEQFFRNNPFFEEVCIFGIPTSPGSRAEIVHLQVHPNFKMIRQHQILEAEPLLKRDIHELSLRLPEYKRPQSIGFSQDPFPKTSTLKIKKHEVKSRFLEQKASHPSPTLRPTDPLLETPLGKTLLKILKSFVADDTWILSTHNLSLDLGFESLKTMEFWSSLEERFKIKIPEEKRQCLKEVKDILEWLSMSSQGTVARPVENSNHASPKDFWKALLQTSSPEIEETALGLLHSHRWARPLFLKSFRAAFRFSNRLEIRGLDRLPSSGPLILAPNHECYLDNLFVVSQLPTSLQKRVIVIGAKEFFDRPLSRTIARWCRTIPLERENIAASVLQIGAEVLKKGNILLIHPEGTRSPNGELLPLRPGAGLLSAALSCPVAPVYIEGAYEFWPKDSKWPKLRSPISVTVGSLLLPASLEAIPDISRNAREITERLRKSYLELRAGRDNSAWAAAPPPSSPEPKIPVENPELSKFSDVTVPSRGPDKHLYH